MTLNYSVVRDLLLLKRDAPESCCASFFVNVKTPCGVAARASVVAIDYSYMPPLSLREGKRPKVTHREWPKVTHRKWPETTKRLAMIVCDDPDRPQDLRRKGKDWPEGVGKCQECRPPVASLPLRPFVPFPASKQRQAHVYGVVMDDLTHCHGMVYRASPSSLYPRLVGTSDGTRPIHQPSDLSRHSLS